MPVDYEVINLSYKRKRRLGVNINSDQAYYWFYKKGKRLEATNKRMLELEATNKALTKKNDELAQALYQASVAKDTMQACYDELEVQLKHIQESESKLKKLFQLSYDAILFINETGTILDCNAACLRMFGFADKQELIGKTTFELTPPSHHAITQRILTKVINNKGHQRFEKHFLTRNGKVFPALVSSSKIDKQSGIISSVIQDISLQKKLEQEQDQQIDLLTRQSMVQQAISKAHAVKDLKISLCQIMRQHTSAESVWLMVTRDGSADSLYYSPMNDGVCQHKQLSYTNLDKQLSFLGDLANAPEQVTHLKGDAVFHLPEFDHTPFIHEQLLFTARLRSGQIFYWGLNYDTHNPEIIHDKAFLQQISPQLASAFDSLEAHEQLTENELRFRALIEKSDDIIVIRNEAGEYSYVSPSIGQYGLEPEDIIGKSAVHFVHPDDMQRIVMATNELFPAPGRSRHLENIRLKLPHGSIAHANLTMTNQLNQKGINGFVINIKDVSETILFEQQLRESEEKYRLLFENGSGGIARFM